jgi:hypothetical protein
LGSVLGALGGGGGLSADTVVAGLKEALRVGTERTVAKTSQPGGYLRNPGIRIEIPEKLQGMADALRTVGMGAQVDRFEAKMNEAAELAAREAAPVFLDAIRQMTIADAKQILEGGDTAATDYFREKTSQALKSRYTPVIESQMSKLGVVKMYSDLQSRYNAIPFVPKVTESLEDYVSDQALDGLFAVLGQEEKKIREDPVARTTDLLRQVFGGRNSQ